MPANGVYAQVGLDPASLKNINPQPYLDQLRDLPPTREGVLRHLELLGLGGIVTFPSFHAASAVLYAWALWVVRGLRPIVILVNGVMLAATPLNGGHYFIDVIAGVTIAVVAIATARLVGRLIARRETGLALIPPIPAAAAEQLEPASAAQ